MLAQKKSKAVAAAQKKSKVAKLAQQDDEEELVAEIDAVFGEIAGDDEVIDGEEAEAALRELVDAGFMTEEEALAAFDFGAEAAGEDRLLTKEELFDAIVREFDEAEKEEKKEEKKEKKEEKKEKKEEKKEKKSEDKAPKEEKSEEEAAPKEE